MNLYQFLSENIWIITGFLSGVIVWLTFKYRSITIGKLKFTNAQSANYFKDTVRLYSRSMWAIKQEIDMIQTRYILRDQMKEADRQIDHVILKMREAHLDLLSTYVTPVFVSSHVAVQRYLQITETVRFHITDRVRTRLRDNHLTEMSDMEFATYTSEISSQILKSIENIVDNGYEHDMLSISELREVHRSKEREYDSLITSIFIKARKVTQDYEYKTACLEEQAGRIEKVFIEEGRILSKEELNSCKDE
jgi:hypothetical protein